jgi:hypothetical protein
MYVVEVNEQLGFVEVVPWMTEIGFEYDDTLASFKGRVECIAQRKVVLQYDPELDERLAKFLVDNFFEKDETTRADIYGPDSWYLIDGKDKQPFKEK